MSTASAPFLCVMCYQESHGVVFEELRATVTALTDEVKELRAALQRVEARGSDVLPSPPTENNEPWHTATRRKKRSRKGNNAGKSEAGATAHGTKQHTQSTNVQRTVNQQASVNPSKKGFTKFTQLHVVTSQFVMIIPCALPARIEDRTGSRHDSWR